MMRISPRYKRSDDYNDNEPDDGMHGTQADADEEAQWLRREELGFEDNSLQRPILRYQPKSFWTSLRGPEPPHVQVIRPIFPLIQQSPIRLLEVRGYNKKILLAIVLLLWFIIFRELLRHISF